MALNVKKNDVGESGSGSDQAKSGIDISEKGRDQEGRQITLDRRLFMHLFVFRQCRDLFSVKGLVEELQPPCVIYQDANDPHGIGILFWYEQSNILVDTVHPLLRATELSSLEPRPEFTMLGRTYAIGYENDLEEVLITRPILRASDPTLDWAIWYPLRRSGRYEQESREEQRKMLMEHGGIGHAYGKAGLATDIRLAAHGLNEQDMDFVVGLLGADLFPLSALVQHMRHTRQTSEFIERMGPFFVGRVIWRPRFKSDQEQLVQ